MTSRPKLIALPHVDSFQLTPKLWLAVGLIAYNHHLMTLEPLQLLTARHAVQEDMHPTRIEAARRGLAVLVSTEGLTPATRYAVAEIARALLNPLGLLVSTHGGAPVPGKGHSTRYMLVEDFGSRMHLSMPEATPVPLVSRVAVVPTEVTA